MDKMVYSNSMSDGTIVDLVGIGIVVLALSIGIISLYAHRSPLLTSLFFLLLLTGTAVLYLSSYIRRKEREKLYIRVNFERDIC